MTGLALVHINGDTTDAVVLSMPSLLYILAISGSIHLINYYRDEVAERGLFGARTGDEARLEAHFVLQCNDGHRARFALRERNRSDPQVRCLFRLGRRRDAGHSVLLPAGRFDALARSEEGRAANAQGAREKALGDRRVDGPCLGLFGGWVIRRHRLVLTASTVLMAFVAYGLMHTRTEISLLKLFHPSARVLHDYVWLEERLGRLIPMEIVLRFNPQSQADPNRADPTDPQRFYQMWLLERMESVALVQDVIERQFGVNAADVVGRSMSAATFAPPIDAESTSTLSFARRSGLNKRLEQSREQFKTSGYFGTDPRDDAELWRSQICRGGLRGCRLRGLRARTSAYGRTGPHRPSSPGAGSR